MNKQQLASRIWRAANKMRGKVDASEYKDYILGFIFYRFLSEQEVRFCFSRGWSEKEIRDELNEDNRADADNIRENLGYFISYKDLYSTWIDKDTDFSIDNVRTALSAFKRNISPNHRGIYEGVFRTLETGLSDLGTTAGQQTKAAKDLLDLIKPIPMDGKQGYDVLGFIYEYLIGNFAANAGKKAGEFYTPHEVAVLMSQIIAYHLRDKDEFSIYDPTSGSSSLLITVGNAVSRASGNSEGIRYYAQEKISSTYNLTRMNLVMHGIKPSNIVTRNADTLEEDWPLRGDDAEGNEVTAPDEPLRVDACTSNPPYSQPWDAKDREGDPRFEGYGVAPKGKADYAFLLHCLYHLKPGGIMTIVLPHGPLFRGDTEGDIRSALVDRNEIDAIIGLPPNIFYGTSIPTIVMVLKRHDEAKGDRGDGSVLFIDASRFYEKDGTKNRLRASDIKRIVDAYIMRRDIPRFARVVPKGEMVANGYNLNIPRYLDTAEPPEPWDLYATMFGGIPSDELDGLDDYWNALPGLRPSLFLEADGYGHVRVDDLGGTIRQHQSTDDYLTLFDRAFSDLPDYLKKKLVDGANDVSVEAGEDEIAVELFHRLSSIPLVDRYDAYQILDNCWNGDDNHQGIEGGLELVQAEGLDAARKVDPHYILKKSRTDSGEEEEIDVVDTKEPWVGHVLPFAVVQRVMFPDELARIDELNCAIASDSSDIGELFDSLEDEEREGSYTNDDNSAFSFGSFDKALAEIASADNDEIEGLVGYLSLLDEQSARLKEIPKSDTKGRKVARAKAKEEKLTYIQSHGEVAWSTMKSSGGVYAAARAKERIADVLGTLDLDNGSLLARLLKARRLNDDMKEKVSALKQADADLTSRTKEAIEGLSDSEVLKMLEACWIAPLVDRLNQLPVAAIDGLVTKLGKLVDKYDTALEEIVAEREEADHATGSMLPRLRGNEKDMTAINELMHILSGDAR